jgi:hypothetical protein
MGLHHVNAETGAQTSYLIADNLRTPQEVQRALLHEAFHGSVRDLLGDKFNPIMEEIYSHYGRLGLAQIAAKYRLDLSKPKDRLIAAEEKLAQMAETGAKPDLIHRVYAAVRSALRAMGFKIAISDADIARILMRSSARLERGVGIGIHAENRFADKMLQQKNSEIRLSIAESETAENPNDRRTPLDHMIDAVMPGYNYGHGMLKGIQSLLFPGAVSKDHLAAAEVLASKLGSMYRRQEAANRAVLDESGKFFDKRGVHNPDIPLTQNEGIKFMSDMSQGREITGRAAGIAQHVQGLFNDRLERLDEAGVPLQAARENYFPGIWTKESRRAFNQAVREALQGGIAREETPLPQWSTQQKEWVRNRTEALLRAGQGSDDTGLAYLTKRPFEGRESFRKQKVFDDIMTGIEFGLKPVSNNPIDLVKLKLAEMDRNIMANEAINEYKDRDDLKFVASGYNAPAGTRPLDDKYGTVYGPPVMNVKEAYDQGLFSKLSQAAANLGVSNERLALLRGRKWGDASITGIRTRFAGPESVLAHEIGHVLDFKYGLWDILVRNVEGVNQKGEVTKTASTQERGKIQRELRDLADLRWEGNQTSESFKKYVRKSSEKMAVILESYIHAPEELQRVAPTVWSHFEEFIDAHPELHSLRDIKPGLVLGVDETQRNIGGFPVIGHYYAKNATADILDNYLSSTLYNNKYFGDAYRGYMAVGNALNQSQLGLGSAFHAGFTTAEAFFSGLANNVKDVYGLLKGTRSPGDVAKGLMHTITAPIANPIQGAKYLQQWLGQANHGEWAETVAKAAELAGAKAYMDPHLRTNQIQAMMRDWYAGNKVRAALRSPIAGMELMAKPIMDWLVPRQKMGVFGELVSRIIQDNPGRPLEDLRPQLRQAWNRVDARLGQVGYDRLFMNNVSKNVIQGIIRAPGWSGGTIAEIGGSLKDTVGFIKEWKDTGRLPTQIPDRVAYTISLLLGAAALNGALTYAFTGEDPKGLDWWAFRTGGKDDAGRDERFVLPTYAKDIMSWGNSPGKTLLAKTHPLINMIGQAVQNKDYMGTEIYPKDAGPIEKFADLAKYGIKQFTPFWMRGTATAVQREEGAGQIAAPLVGIMPAPRNINRTAAEALMDQYAEARRSQGARTQERTDRSNLENQIIRNMRIGKNDEAQSQLQEAIKQGVLSKTDIQSIHRRSKLEPLVAEFQPLSLDQALTVWEKANPDERQALLPYLRKKGRNMKSIPAADQPIIRQKWLEAMKQAA